MDTPEKKNKIRSQGAVIAFHAYNFIHMISKICSHCFFIAAICAMKFWQFTGSVLKYTGE